MATNNQLSSSNRLALAREGIDIHSESTPEHAICAEVLRLNEVLTSLSQPAVLADAEVTAYALAGGISVERCIQRSGSVLWAVRDWHKSCLSKSGEWDDEPLPSARTEEWISQHRFHSAQEAFAHARRFIQEKL